MVAYLASRFNGRLGRTAAAEAQVFAAIKRG
jgi:hypothetical protein